MRTSVLKEKREKLVSRKKYVHKSASFVTFIFPSFNTCNSLHGVFVCTTPFLKINSELAVSESVIVKFYSC